MRRTHYVLAIFVAAALFAVGFVAADLSVDADTPQGTWHYSPEYEWDAEATVNALPAECALDIEPIQAEESHVVIVAYACPESP